MKKINILLIGGGDTKLQSALKGIFLEIIETLLWGFDQLGYESKLSLNDVDKGSTNIVFCFQLLGIEDLKEFPSDTIFYNFEQLRGLTPLGIKPIYAEIAKRFQIWEYSLANMSAWESLGLKFPVMHVPVGYAPLLERIPQEEKDIDVLFYGGLSPERIRVLDSLGLTPVAFASNMFGLARDRLIARSKIVLNINRLKSSSIFEIARVSYLLANGITVVADESPITYIEEDIREGIAFSHIQEIASVSHHLLAKEDLRINLGKKGQELFRKRDIVSILRPTLELME